MKIEISRAEKLVLLKACQSGILDTDTLPALKLELDKRRPARVLTPAEAKEYLGWIEKEC
jgi:hypothetical protein